MAIRPKASSGKTRHLVLVLGDQLDGESAAFDGFDRDLDAVLQMEVREEAAYIPQHKKRIAFFFASMRHFRDEQHARGRRTIYSALDDPANRGSFAEEIQRRFEELKPERIVAAEPGDWRVRDVLAKAGLPIEIREDRHFLCSTPAFEAFSASHKRPILETFYRFMRKRLGILLEPDGSPQGGAWNFDADNRETLSRKSAPEIPAPLRFEPDKIVRDVLKMTAREFPDSPGRLDGFDMPVTRNQSLAALDDFARHRLPHFGRYQDAMLGGEPFLFHSLLSGPLNLHRLTPREVADAVLANPAGAPLNAVEGYIRQIIGWREFVRGIYWRHMPDYAERNALQADLPVPAFFWTGETDMRCLSEAIRHTIDHAYAHHIERLMVLGLFCLLLGVRPYDVHRWHMSMFWDAIDWVSLPNTLGMSQHGDGGIVGTKPYAASGNYINRMSDHCRSCRYNPGRATGDDACPFTTLYWDFLDRHKARFVKNMRMKYPYLNLARKDEGELRRIRQQADALKTSLTAQSFL